MKFIVKNVRRGSIAYTLDQRGRNRTTGFDTSHEFYVGKVVDLFQSKEFEKIMEFKPNALPHFNKDWLIPAGPLDPEDLE